MNFALIFILIVAFILAVPLMTIWSLNTLFTLGIAYTVNNWIAAWWLGLVVGVSNHLSCRQGTMEALNEGIVPKDTCGQAGQKY